MIKLIGVHGKKGHGKDTFFKVLEDLYNSYAISSKPQRDAFADKLKRSAAASLGCSDDPIGFCNWLKEGAVITIMDDRGNVVDGFSGREYLQWYGTEAHRDIFNRNFWIDAVLPDINDPDRFGRSDIDDNTLLVITDVRFPNEAKAIRKAGGIVVLVDASDRILDDSDMHTSEKILPKELIDYAIDNNGTPNQFRSSVVAFSDLFRL